MSQSVQTRNMPPNKPVKMSRTLTDEELELQRVRGLHHRKLMKQITSDMVDAVDKSKIGLMLSGGVDSTTILWQLLELGVRPRLYTIQIPTVDKDSKDTARAKALAERYSLPLQLVTMPQDEDQLVRDISDLSDSVELRSRADFEVLIMYSYLMRSARDEGCTTIFSGVADEAIHIVGRKGETRGRTGRISLSEANFRRMLSCGNPQTESIVQLASSHGLNIGLPLMPLAHSQPYFDVPWKVMNVPRLKAITMRPWEKEEEQSGIKVIVNPMQCGDSGSRQYFDGSIRRSKLAAEIVGRKPTSGQVLYNALKRIRAEREGTTPPGAGSIPDLDWISYVAENIEPGPKSFIPVKEDGLAKDPSSFAGYEHISENGEDPLSGGDIFDILDEGEDDHSQIERNPDGSLDRRVDCLGYPFWMPEAERTCERAKAGLCGGYYPENPHRYETCSNFLDFMNINREYLKELSGYASSELRPVYSRWADKAYDLCEQIRNGTRQYD